MKKNKIIILIGVIFINSLYSQEIKKMDHYFDNPVLIDTSGIILIPIKYDISISNSSKLGGLSYYYSNIIFEDVRKDSRKKLFEKDSYIKPLKVGSEGIYYSSKFGRTHSNSITKKWILYIVNNVDLNKNRKIDSKDPAILYVTDLKGENLKKITSENENVIDFFVYENYNVVLIKIQKDSNGDNQFTYKDDKDYYFIKLDLERLELLNRIELE